MCSVVECILWPDGCNLFIFIISIWFKNQFYGLIDLYEFEVFITLGPTSGVNKHVFPYKQNNSHKYNFKKKK